MTIKETLIREHSKSNTEMLAAYIGSDEALFAELMDCLMNGEEQLPQRAAWVLSHCLEAHPELGSSYLKDMLDLLDRSVHDALKRAIFRSLDFMTVPKEYQGRLLDLAFAHLLDRKQATAIRVFAMTVIYKMTRQYPEIKPELDAILQDEMEYGSAGMKSRARKMLAGKW